MNKLTIGIIVTSIIFLIIFVMYLIVLNQKNNPPVQSIQPTSIPIPSSRPLRELEVVQTNPKDETTNIPISTTINLTFNESLQNRPIAISIAPAVPFIQKGTDKNVIITFSQPLSPGTLYTYTIKYPNTNYLPQSFVFTTTGPTQRFLPNTYPGNIE
ncbi:hypothetical protein A2866_03160 [Candidatus Roizmanbacteria bacterium RIFCSPHIGHO2_01_FULL_39_8]|uniref:SbsA Ig-like domain-containing protein n=3 Tax=Candidatus Roizmaniibacteriota TaxID=1752723 RepID=A0A1F7GGM0_9BACT|nr:MAG: hypothetical protein A2866_03160 [Candidatus Roizmanbacteria bacterium RIFCSPHIGHO2_01_FULL_39_8]OGK25332.1 MAG: hypothetical protein A3C28_00945 [Candidatus Roizmanbacteria bacterium RIFCSPHIGHO2_02_FULL_39_9]OGK37614.1 MAG: hypothetical protein A3F60_01805 [Candidatus Roizmanbacteria bacterium RIFCSPHIGHO2_12_FULL_39_8]